MEQTSRPATTCQETSGRYRATSDARERFEELTVRDVSARALMALVARGDYDPRIHGDVRGFEPLGDRAPGVAQSGTTTIPLVGTHGFEIRFPADELPPHGSDGFWSITLLNAAGSLAANPIGRYSIGDETRCLVRGANGSLTIVVSASRPAQPDLNWLPAPTSAFGLVLRVYDPTPQVLDGCLACARRHPLLILI